LRKSEAFLQQKSLPQERQLPVLDVKVSSQWMHVLRMSFVIHPQLLHS
jgi:hypothetical protein